MYSVTSGVCCCEPDGIQTHDLQNRNLTLYSAKLRVPIKGFPHTRNLALSANSLQR